MAVTSWKLHWEGRRSSRSVGEITATRRYLVITNDKTDDEYTILTNSNSPAIGDPYDNDPFLRVNNVTPEQSSGEPLKWMVTVDYSTSVPDDPDETLDDPLDRPPEVQIGQVRSTEPVKVIPDYFNRTANTNIVLENSAGVPYDPPLERSVVDTVIVVTQNLPVFVANDVLGFKGAVNADKFDAFDPGQCHIEDIQYRKITERGITFWQRTVEIHAREKTADYSWDTVYPWQQLVENVGYMQLSTDGTRLVPATDEMENQVQEPAKLDANGRQINQDQTTTFKRWDMFPKKNFADLNIRLQ